MAPRRRSTRLAAWLALAGAAGLALSVAVLLVHDALAVATAVLALAVAGFAGWQAARRRRRARIVWAAGAGLAFAAAGLALVLGEVIGELVVIAGTLALLGVALRYAFDEPTAPRARAARRERRVLIVNPRSGDGKAGRAGLEQEARRRGIDPVVLAGDVDLRSLAEDVALRADVIGMAGGDGSQALVADVARAHDLAFVCVPAGTRNHFALDLGIDPADIAAALDAFDAHSCVEHCIDLGQVNGRTFVNNVSLGVYAEIVRDEGYRNAKLATTARLLPELLGDGGAGTGLTFADPNGGLHEGPRVLLVSNNPYVLARMVGFGARPRLDTGLLGIVAIEVGGAGDAAALVSLEAVGGVSRFEGWHEWTSAGLTVDAPGPVNAGVDGEAVVLAPPLVFASLPRALRVRLSPAAERRRALRAKEHAGAAEVLQSLWEIAAR